GYAGEPARAPVVRPGEAQEVQARDAGDAPIVRGVAPAVEDRCLDPPVVPAEPGTPDHRGDTGFVEVHSGGFLFGPPHRYVAWLGWGIDVVRLDVAVDRVLDAFRHRVGVIEVLFQVQCEPQRGPSCHVGEAPVEPHAFA